MDVSSNAHILESNTDQPMTLTVDVPANAHTFEHSSVIPTTLDEMIRFHEAPQAFAWLTPPPIFAQVHRRELKSLTDGELEFTLWFLVVPVRWLARHEQGPTPHSFQDRMMQGPMAYWLHRHIFEEVEGGVKLTDRITLSHKPGIAGLFTRLVFDGLPLRFLFIYRHLRTRLQVKRL